MFKSIKINLKKLLIPIILMLLLAIIINPSIYIQSCLNGILVWSTIVLPSLLPFMFFTKTLSVLGIEEILNNKFKFFSKIYNTPPCSLYVFFMSILSGYPVGAKMVSDLYENGTITRTQAFRISTFTSNSGPMFILGSVGIGMLANKKLGLIIFFSHIIGALINGLIYRKHKEEELIINKKNSIKTSFEIGDVMWNTVRSVLLVGGFIAIFFVICEVFNNLGIFNNIAFLLSKITGLNAPIFSSIFNGLLEITKGCLEISKLAINEDVTAILLTAIITFGGFATAMQAIVFLKKFKMKMSFFFKQKITHTIFSTIVCAILLLIF